MALINLVLPTTAIQWLHLTFWNCTRNPVVIYTHSLVLIHNYQYQCKLLNALINRKTAIYHATIQHLLALFRKQCPLVAQASKRNMENLCLVSRVPYTAKSSTEAHMPNCRNPNNLITIQRLPLKASNAHHMSTCPLNSQSINNKVLIIKDYVVDYQIDIWGITETWTKSDGESNRVVNEMSHRGNSFIHLPRKKRSGGGINLLYNTSLKIERVDCNSYASFEYLEVKLHTASTVVRIAVVYCPPSSKVNKLTSPSSFMILTICLNTSQFPLVGF